MNRSFGWVGTMKGLGFLSLAVLAAGCGSSGVEEIYPLASGNYSIELVEAPVDTCWPQSSLWPPLVDTEIEIATEGDNIDVTTPDVSQWLFPAFAGIKDGNELLGKGTYSYELTDLCSLRATLTFQGEMVGGDEFEGTVTVTYDAGINNRIGTPSDCTALAGTTISYLVPFPELNDPATGSCDVALTIDGAAARVE